jgi:hypothetical protein
LSKEYKDIRKKYDNNENNECSKVHFSSETIKLEICAFLVIATRIRRLSAEECVHFLIGNVRYRFPLSDSNGHEYKIMQKIISIEQQN